MKLVDILARELKVWPEGAATVEMSQANLKLNFYKVNGDYIHYYGQPFQRFVEGQVTYFEWQAAVDAVNAPKAVEWSGQGLPPAGVECEFLSSRDGLWKQGTVLVHDKHIDSHVAILRVDLDGGGVEYHPGVVFRPIRTPEQIAAEEREEALKEMTHGHEHALLRDWAVYIYDTLGYRKQVAE